MEATKTTIEAETLAELATLSQTAAAAQTAQDTAHAARLDAEAQVLCHILRVAGPALRAICGPVRRALDWCEDPTGGDYPSDGEGTLHYVWRGICLDGPTDGVGPMRKRRVPGDTHGTYTGEDLLLDTGGSLRLVEYTGRWSQWDGESSGWTSTVSTLTAREAVERITPERALQLITEALHRACDGNAAARTAKNLARAAKLDAMLTLLTLLHH